MRLCLVFLLSFLSVHAQLWPARGRVIDALSGVPIAGVRVRTPPSVPMDSPSHLDMLTDETGSFDLPDAAQSPRLIYEREGLVALTSEDLVGPDGTHPLVYLEGQRQTVAPIFKLMLRLSTISGTIVDQRDRPIAGARIQARPFLRKPIDPDGGLNEVTADGDGRFSLQALPLETDLTLTDPTQRVTDLVEGKPPMGRLPVHYTVHLAPGEARTGVRLEIAPARTYSVTGTVTNLVPPFAGAEIVIKCDGVASFAYTNQTGGQFTLEGIPPGKHRITALLHKALPDGCDTCSDEPRYVASENIEVTTSGLSGVGLAIYPGLSLKGQMHFEGREPSHYVQARVFLRGLDAALASSAYHWNRTTDPRAIDLSRIQPGNYRVAAGGLRGEFYLREVRIDGKPAEERRLQVGTADPPSTIDAYFSPLTASLRLDVTDSDGRPLTTFTAVLLDCPDPSSDTPYSMLTARRAPLAEGTGRTGLPPGRYRVLAVTPALLDVAPIATVFERYSRQATPVELVAGQNQLKVVAIEAHPFAAQR